MGAERGALAGTLDVIESCSNYSTRPGTNHLAAVMGKSFGSFLRKLRRSRGLTQRELAKRVGVNYTYLSKVENDTPGFSSLSEETLHKMAKALEADPDEVIARSGKIPSDVRRILVDDFSLIKEIRSQYATGGDVSTSAEDRHEPADGEDEPADGGHDTPKKRDARPTEHDTRPKKRRKSHGRQK